MFIYSDTEKSVQPRFPVPYDRLDASKHYLTHYGNWRYLNFILMNPLATRIEKHQANKEIVICTRKLTWWQKHPNYNQLKVDEGRKAIDKQWDGK